MNRTRTAPEIQHRIYLIRDQKVMLDTDLAEVYGIATKRLNEQVKRNRFRFPEDFMFQLTEEEATQLMRSQNATASPPSSRSHFATLDGPALRSQIATSKIGRGGRRYRPF